MSLLWIQILLYQEYKIMLGICVFIEVCRKFFSHIREKRIHSCYSFVSFCIIQDIHYRKMSDSLQLLFWLLINVSETLRRLIRQVYVLNPLISGNSHATFSFVFIFFYFIKIEI